MLTPIDWLKVPGRRGRVGMMACPGGARQRDTDDRAITLDLDYLYTAGTRMLVSLLPDDELRMLRLGRIDKLALQCGIHWLQLPIEDMRAPGQSFEIRWAESGPLLHAQIAAGNHIALHCYAGLGRTGTVAARLLVETGLAPAEAIAQVRRVRPGAIQTLEQERYVLALGVVPAAT